MGRSSTCVFENMGLDMSALGRSAFYTPLRYPGGKGKLAPFVKQILERNNLVDGVYVEPYAGGAAVAMELVLQEYVRSVLINDIDQGVAAFWRSLLDDTESLCKLIVDTDVTIDEWHRQKLVQTCSANEGDLALGFATFFLNRTNRSGILRAGVIGGKSQAGTWKLDARFNKADLVRRIESIARVKSRIKFHQLDAVDFIDLIASELPDKSLVYLDPPYYVKGGDLYLNSYLHDDHVRIAAKVGGMRNVNWIVSYDDAEPIHELYAKFRGIVYGLSYSAQQRYKGGEAMFFSEGLVIPGFVRPMHHLADVV